MILKTQEELKSHQDAKVCYICRRGILQKLTKKNIDKLEIIAIIQVNIEPQQIVFNVLYEIPVVFDNGSDHDYHFIIKESASNWENLDSGGKIQKGTKAFLFQTKKKLQKMIKIEFFFFYHHKNVHRLTSYKNIKNKSK